MCNYIVGYCSYINDPLHQTQGQESLHEEQKR